MLRLPAVLTLLTIAGSAMAGDIAIPSASGFSIPATEYGEGTKAVVLVHDDGRSRADWETIAPRLASAGFRAVAIDLRSYGDSTSTIGEEDHPKLVEDITTSVQWLTAQGAESVAVVGVGLGANLALNAAATESSIGNLALISPRPNIKGVKVLKAIETYQGPIFIGVGATSAIGVRTADALEERATGNKKVVEAMAKANSRGLLDSNPDLEGALQAWLKTGGQAMATGELAGPQAVSTGDNTHIQTTGTAYGESRN